jgi:CRISPR-associated protein Cas2
MRRASRYRGVLQPREQSAPRGETPLLLLYDIEEDRLRNRVSQLCLDYGLERIQFSAFFGRLTRNMREELALRLLREVEKENCRIRLIPVPEESLKEMWEYDWWRKDADKLAEKAKLAEQAAPAAVEEMPRLKIIKVPEDW